MPGWPAARFWEFDSIASDSGLWGRYCDSLPCMPTQVRRWAPRSPVVAVKQIRKLADTMLASLELLDAELSVLLTNDVRIRELNRTHRHKDCSTDVLSFFVDPGFDNRTSNVPRILGDIVISLDTAARQAVSRKRPLILEIRWLLAHGLLHLIGFDHANARDKKRMRAWTIRLVRAAALPKKAVQATAHAKQRLPVKAPARRRITPGTARNQVFSAKK